MAMASGSSSSDGGNVCPCPASILLAEKGYVAASRNGTTARARSKDKHTVEITFWVADPPAASFYTFHCVEAEPDPILPDFPIFHSAVAGAHGRFVLLRALVNGDDQHEFFVYTAHPESPSLETVPLVPFQDRLRTAQFGIVPRGVGDDDDGHYLLVALRCFGNQYGLYTYSSEDGTWRTEVLLNPPCPVVRTILPHKVFTLGDGGVVLFVDLVLGVVMVTFDVLQEHRRARYIPLPEPLPGNREKVERHNGGAWGFRDLTCVDGRIKFIDIEHREIVREIVTDVPPQEPPSDPRTKAVLYDSELIMQSKKRPVENKPKIQRLYDGWSAIVWTREIGSNFWRRGSVFDVNDLLVDDSVFSALSLSSEKSESAGSLEFKNLRWAQPTLSTDGNDIVYLRSFSEELGGSLPASVDLVEKTLKVEAPGVRVCVKYPPRCPPLQQVLRPCALASKLKMTPGIKVLASPIALMGSSANEPNSTGIRVGEPDSYESENKRPRRRLLGEKLNHAQHGAQSTVQNGLISQAHPNQNNMPPRPCFNRYQQPGYSGYSSWPHQNNVPPLPSCFNNWAGPYNPVYAPFTQKNPVYAPLAPVPNVQSYVNYQSLPQHPLLQEQRTTPSMAFGPRMAHPIYTSTTGMEPATMGIGSSINPYAYGAHSGIDIYHQHR